MPNRLTDAMSPYLQQHADNPVDWWEWGPEAFDEARRRDVPVFLSVGYAACHWCHVMAHESFEDDPTARLLNERFVAIKVDREERPDVDATYMAATTALTGHGGWPMSVWLDHDGRAFYAGTYFPREPRAGMPSFTQVLRGLDDAWRNRRDEVRSSAVRIDEALGPSRLQVLAGDSHAEALTDVTHGAVEQLQRSFDPLNGGFGRAPKFPPSMVCEFLLRHHVRTGDPRALQMASATLAAMARGGIHDQLAGGFARYSVDGGWVVPHFEKMLYDNAQLLGVYAYWWQITGDDLARRVTEQTAQFLLRDLVTGSGGLAAALDADAVDSDAPDATPVEGASYVWTPEQLRAVLGPNDAGWAAALLEVTDAGTFERGASTLQLRAEPDDAPRWHGVRARLLAARDQRPQPMRDDKVVAAWNGLAIAGLARAGFALGRPEWIDAARSCADTLIAVHVRADGRLARASRDGAPALAVGVLADYADLAEGLLALFCVTGDEQWFVEAGRLLAVMVEEFMGHGRWVDHRADERLPAASDPSDNAEPSGASAAASALLTYASLGGSIDQQGWSTTRELSEQLVSGQVEFMATHPRFAGKWLATAEALLSGPVEVAIVFPPSDPSAQPGDPSAQPGDRSAQPGESGAPTGGPALVDVVRSSPSPGLVLAMGETGTPSQVPLLASRVDARAPGGSAVDQPSRDAAAAVSTATAYVCRGLQCDLPTSDPQRLASQLRL